MIPARYVEKHEAKLGVNMRKTCISTPGTITLALGVVHRVFDTDEG